MRSIADQVERLGSGPLTEEGLREHIWPLFSRAMAGDEKRGEIYLANHSLGRPLDQTELDLREFLDHWYSEMDQSWGPWLEEVERFRGSVARLIGLQDSKCVVPKTSAGQGLRAVLNSFTKHPIEVVATRGEFDSIDFILKVFQERGLVQVRWVEPTVRDGVPLFEPSQVLSAIGPDTDLVVLSKVVFGTGQVMGEVEEVCRRAHQVGAKVLIDAYHAAGVIPMELGEADFMVGGSYKYFRGGPGACWLALHPRVAESDVKTLDTGWFAKRAPFSYARPDIPERGEGGDGWMESTPPVITFYQARAGLQLLLGLGIGRQRQYNLEQQQLLRSSLREHGCPVFEPADPADFGAFSLVPHDHAKAFSSALSERGVKTDARGGFVRFGPDLMNSRDSLVRAGAIAGEVFRSFSGQE